MKKHLSLAVRLIVSVGILAYLFNGIFRKEAAEYFIAQNIDPNTLTWWERTQVFWTVGPSALWDVFRGMNLWWFAAAIACFGGVCLCGTVRWRMILHAQGLMLGFWRTGSIFLIGHFFNAFMLGATGGDVVKALYAAHETHHKKAEAVSTVLVDRLIGLMGLLLLALAMMALFAGRVMADERLRWFAQVTALLVAGTVGVTVAMIWPGWTRRMPGLWQWTNRLPKIDVLRRMLDAYRKVATKPDLLFKTIFLSLAVHILVIIGILCVARGLDIHTVNGLPDYLLCLPVINTVSAMPISISGLGVREAMYAEMFRPVGVPESQAVALSLLGFLVGTAWSVVGGFFFLTHRRELPPATEMAVANE